MNSKSFKVNLILFTYLSNKKLNFNIKTVKLKRTKLRFNNLLIMNKFN